jgi:hypothetical protein
MFRVLAVGAACLVATAASAQSPYVALTVGSDVSRFSSTTFNDTLRVDGEALTFAARAGTPIGESWGVEFELIYPSRNSFERIQDSPLIMNPTSQQAQVASSLSLSIGPIGVTPQFRVRVKRRNPTADVAAWLAHNVREGMQLRYLAGIAIHRFTQLNNVDVVPQRGLSVSSRQIGETEEISYGLGPMAGIEARWMARGAVFLTVGTRLHGFSGGWIVRPSAGAGWSF